MRFAIITDIHGNRYALEAVLEDIVKQSVDEIVVAGDSVNIHPFSKVCWDIIQSLDCPIIKGNHEYYLYALGTADANPAWMSTRFQMLKYHQAQFTQSELATMRNLAMTYRVDAPSPLIVTHASLRNLFDNIEADTPNAVLAKYFPTPQSSLIIRGHNHRWQGREWRDNLGHTNKLYTIASLGMPYDCGFGAPYITATLIDGSWEIERHSVEYDREAALAAFDKDYIAAAGAMAKISKLEFATAKNFFIAFLRQYVRAIDDGEIDFATAVDEYLGKLAKSMDD